MLCRSEVGGFRERGRRGVGEGKGRWSSGVGGLGCFVKKRSHRESRLCWGSERR